MQTDLFTLKLIGDATDLFTLKQTGNADGLIPSKADW